MVIVALENNLAMSERRLTEVYKDCVSKYWDYKHKTSVATLQIHKLRIYDTPQMNASRFFHRFIRTTLPLYCEGTMHHNSKD
ncbi:hypothetical protein NQ317_003621 [Molorchus minor]|uniref:Uncharacterized protein n=1 Tax=Molorchus minor TaxID=1323400 RepID=A0ABQ9JHF8_9CUCU|nr:hypothetical protein NQ317_003621 [Molorchus minor]